MHNLDTPEDEVREILEGRNIVIDRDVNGHPMRPIKEKVLRITKFVEPKDGGKAILYIDGNQQNRSVNFREISEIR